MAVNVKASVRDMLPAANGRDFVLDIFLSVSLSKIWLSAAEAAASRAKPTKLANPLNTLVKLV